MIVITGASDGLGLGLARLYQADGKTVVNVSRRTSAAADTDLLHDLGQADEVVAAAEEVLKINEPLEALVNCAGVMTMAGLGEITPDELRRVMAINVDAAVLLTSNLIKRIKADGSDVVNVSSTLGVRGKVENILYGTSKWALRGLSANLQVELQNYPCRVISFCPGGFQTKIFEKVSGVNNDAEKGAMMSSADVAKCLKQLLDLPKNMEVSEIIITRKKVTL